MDNVFTNKIADFLAIEHPTDAQVIEGATLLLQADPMRSRGIFNSAMRRPQAMLPWIRTDLKKHLGVRKRGLTRETVTRFNQEALTRVRETLSVVPSDLPKTEKTGNDIPTIGTRGKREDHEQLPEDIQEIWDKNRERWLKMRSLHAQLAQMIAKPGYAPCDGNELCHTLSETDKELRADWERYDKWTPSDTTDSPDKSDKDSVDAVANNVRTIQSARTAITRGLRRKSQTDASIKKLQEAYDTLKALHQAVKPETEERLRDVGVKL